MLTVKEKDFKSFFKVPFHVRAGNKLYAAPFKFDLKKQLSLKNPIFKTENDFTYYTVFKNNTPVGRITAHVHKRFNEKFKLNRCYFGFFESINDQEVANTLFGLAEKWGKERGFTSIAGNFNLTAMQEMGFMIDGFDKEPYIAQSFGVDYYPQLLQAGGYTPTFPMKTFEIDLEKINPELLLGEKQKSLLKNLEYEFIPITKTVFDTRRDDMIFVFNIAFENNPFFVPYTRTEFDFQANDLTYFIDSSISYLVEHNKKPIAISIHIPDINPFLRKTKSTFTLATLYYFIKNKLKRERCLCVFSAVLPEYHSKGILGGIAYLSVKNMKKRGYKKFGITWISDSNIGSLKKVSDLNGKKLHELRIFEKNL